MSHTGVVLDVIGGEEEALCDYASASFATGRRDGLFLDLGGGSAQIIGADEGGICFSVSLDAGALRMKKFFVAGNLPTRAEYAAVKRHVTSVLEQNRIPLLLGGDSMTVMGGTASCLPRLFAAVGREGEILEGQCSISELRLMRDAVFDVGEGMESFLRKAVGERALVILPGMAVLEGFFSYFSILRIRILSCGSREGYALRKLASLGYFSQFFHS